MITTLFALLTSAAPMHFFTGPASFNDVGVSNSSYPSISADGTKIAYLYVDTSTGYSSAHVYNVSTSTDIVVSGSLIYVGEPRISRDGTAVSFMAGKYIMGTGYLVLPYIASATSVEQGRKMHQPDWVMKIEKYTT